MKKSKVFKKLILGSLFCIFIASCKMPAIVSTNDAKKLPSSYNELNDTANSAELKWRDFFADKNLVALIDTALKNNFEILSSSAEMQVAFNEMQAWNASIFPKIQGGIGSGVEKVGRYTSEGAGDASTDITPGKLVPDPLNDHVIGFKSTWEVDVWGKIHNSKRAALARYLASVDGKNFLITNLVAEISNSYYELLALDNKLQIIRESIKLQSDQLEIVRAQKEAAQVTELAVKQFEAQLLNSQGMEQETIQKITLAENYINFLTARIPQKIERNAADFLSQQPQKIKLGIPSQLLKNRPDVQQAEHELLATKFDVKAARAEFYPSFGITGNIGYQAFKFSYLFNTPQSLIYSFIGDIAAPLVNRSAIKAEFNKAKAMQLKALYNYQKSILTGYIEVSNEMSNINRLQEIFKLKEQEVNVMKTSIDISIALFKAAKANYLEVLKTQNDALESRLELVETQKNQFTAITNIYKALGGGWR